MDTVYFRPGNGTRGSAETGACQGHVWSRRAKCWTEPRPPRGAVPGVRPAHRLRACHSGRGLLGLLDPVYPGQSERWRHVRLQHGGVTLTETPVSCSGSA